ncbi:pyridoxamine 5'-phosphate oxidase family protein [Pseudonocardia sp. RS010]|uniref:pyridoxamine 5'-phosphate oxidase family protein n=1 Tax=Pseudonocardia sp. RS010 TaxID=3385979 RepID=UPI00399F9A1A
MPIRPAERTGVDSAQCRVLLAKAAVGRVLFTDMAMPAAVPVVYVLDDDAVVFRVSDDSPLAPVGGSVVGFETDDLDPATGEGWSVGVVGLATEVTDPTRLDALSTVLPGPPHGRTLAITLARLNGRRHAPQP